jgi:2-polyprenyl-3-methyl-5-hydroxy-6-metoxy-1,4-benzoquinol methylase
MFHVEQKTRTMANKVCTVKDHLVSGETFDILWDKSKGFARTHPQPSEQKLDSYYNSTDYISHNQKTQSLVGLLYQIARRQMFRIKTRMFKNELSDQGTILDYGCGTGDFLEYAASQSYKVYGVETNSGARKQANEKGFLVVDSWEKLPNNQFDLISLWHVFEHVFDLEACINEFNLRLNKNGTLLIAVPNLNSYDAKHYNEYWAAYDAPRHLWHFPQTGIISLMDSKGFELKAKHPLILDALYISYVSEKHKGSKTPLIKGVLKGIVSNLKAKKSGEYSSLVYAFKKKN